MSTRRARGGGVDPRVLAEALHAVIEEEHKLYQNNPWRPLPRSVVERVVSSALNVPLHEARRLVDELVRRGFLLDTGRGLRSLAFEYAHKFSDLRKYTGYCTGEFSEMRTLGYALRLCRLPLPDFAAVKASALAGRLLGLGGVGQAAARIASAWWPSYSREQEDVVAELVSSLERRGVDTYLVDMPTGSGKTEAFMIPALAAAMEEGLSIVVYPRRALASDQLRRLIELYAKLTDRGLEPPPAAVYDGDSCSPTASDPSRRCSGRFRRVEEAMVGERRCQVHYRDGGTRVELRCDDGRGLALPLTDMRLEALARRSRLPRVLITTYDMLNLVLASIKETSLSDLVRGLEPRRIMLVFDEAHEFQGPGFMHLVLILARFVETLRDMGLAGRVPVTLVFSSATLPARFEDMMRALLSRLLGRSVSVQVLPRRRGGGPERAVLVTLVAPDPNTAGQWLYQLGLFALTTFSLARLKQGHSPIKTIAFVDSIRYMWEIYNNTIKTLFDHADSVIRDHVPPLCGQSSNPMDPLDWTLPAGGPRAAQAAARELGNTALQRYDPARGRGVFAVHHAGLGAGERQRLETDLKRGNYPLTVLSTSTLEMGIDIPSVANILQFRRPRSEASMMQRLGRAARSAATLYTGYATVFLTSLPSDALLLLDEDTLKRYLYGCTNIQAPRPEARAPANRMILLGHLFLTALSWRPDLAMALTRRPNRGLAPDSFAQQARRLIQSRRAQLEQLAQAVLEAYRQAGLHGLDYSPGELVDEIIHDLEAAEKRLSPASIDPIQEGLARLLQGLQTIADAVLSRREPLGRLLDALDAIHRRDTATLRDYSGLVNPALAGNVKLLIETQRAEWFRELVELADSLRHTARRLLEAHHSLEELLESLAKGRIGEDLLNRLARSLRDARNSLESLAGLLDRLRELLAGDAASLLASPGAESVTAALERLAGSVDGLLRQALEAYSVVLAKKHALEGQPIYALLVEAAGKPYFNPYIRSAPLRVRLHIDCSVDPKTFGPRGCVEEREESPVHALYRLVPLSVGGRREEPTFTFLPPGGERGAHYTAVAVAYNPKRHDYFLCEVSYTAAATDLLHLHLGSSLANAYRSLARSRGPAARVRAELGDRVGEAAIPAYSALASLLQHRLAEKRAYTEKGVYNVVYLGFALEASGGRPLDDVRILLRLGQVENGRVAPYRPSKSLPVGYCSRARLLVVGAEVDPKSYTGPVSWVDCPLARIAKYYQAQLAAGNDSVGRIGLSMVQKICPLAGTRRCPGSILVSDVYTYMVRAKPLVGVFLSPPRRARTWRADAGVVGLEVIESGLEYRYNWLVLDIRYSVENIVYPLPARITAPIKRTYVAILGVDRAAVDAMVDKLKAWARSVGGRPLLLRWLTLKLMLAAAGALREKEWSQLAGELVDAAARGDTGRLRDVLKEMAVVVNRRVLRRLLRGDSFLLAMSGVRRGAETLMDMAVGGVSPQPVYDAFASLLAAGDSEIEAYVRGVAELTLAHTAYYAVASLNGYDYSVRLHRAQGPGGGGHSYVLVEEQEGGIGYLPTVTSAKLAADLRKAVRLASKAMMDIHSGRERARQNLKQRTQRLPRLASYSRLIEEIARRVAEAYGAISRAGGHRDTVYTFIPAWLARTVLTADKLAEYAKKLGHRIGIDQREWSHIVAEILPAYFDADTPDAPTTHIGGVDSWLGEYERRLLQSTLLAQLLYAHIQPHSTQSGARAGNAAAYMQERNS